LGDVSGVAVAVVVGVEGGIEAIAATVVAAAAAVTPPAAVPSAPVVLASAVVPTHRLTSFLWNNGEGFSFRGGLL